MAPHSPLPHPSGVSVHRARIPHGSGDSDGDGSRPHRTHPGRMAGWGQDPAPAWRDPPRQGPPRCRVPSCGSHPCSSPLAPSPLRAARPEPNSAACPRWRPARARPRPQPDPAAAPAQRGQPGRGGWGHPGPLWHHWVLVPWVPAGSVPVEVKAHGAGRWGQPEMSPQKTQDLSYQVIMETSELSQRCPLSHPCALSPPSATSVSRLETRTRGAVAGEGRGEMDPTALQGEL